MDLLALRVLYRYDFLIQQKHLCLRIDHMRLVESYQMSETINASPSNVASEYPERQIFKNFKTLREVTKIHLLAQYFYLLQSHLITGTMYPLLLSNHNLV